MPLMEILEFGLKTNLMESFVKNEEVDEALGSVVGRSIKTKRFDGDALGDCCLCR